MAKLTRRMKVIAEKVDGQKAYPIDEAVNLLSELSKSKRCGHAEVLYLSALVEGAESESIALRISH